MNKGDPTEFTKNDKCKYKNEWNGVNTCDAIKPEAGQYAILRGSTYCLIEQDSQSLNWTGLSEIKTHSEADLSDEFGDFEAPF